MAKIEDPRQRTVAAIFDRYVRGARDDERRGHLGASIIGRPCSREIFYRFRWALREEFDGRILRLFERGRREEAWLLDELRAIGCDVQAVDPATGDQWRVSFLGGHFGGSADGVLLGLVEAPKTYHLFEVKTADEKSWADIARKGVKAAKPEHEAQMQVYMHGLGLTRAAYFAVNKNDDQIHYERVEYDKDAALALIAKARMVIEATAPPSKISEDPTSYLCRFCSFRGPCQLGQVERLERSCRTCLRSTPREDGAWHCAKFDKTLSLDEQEKGCEKHLFIPSLLKPAEAVDASEEENTVTYHRSDGSVWVDGRGGQPWLTGPA